MQLCIRSDLVGKLLRTGGLSRQRKQRGGVPHRVGLRIDFTRRFGDVPCFLDNSASAIREPKRQLSEGEVALAAHDRMAAGCGDEILVALRIVERARRLQALPSLGEPACHCLAETEEAIRHARQLKVVAPVSCFEHLLGNS